MQGNNISVENISSDFGDARFFLYYLENNTDTLNDSTPVLHRHSYYELHIIKKGAYTFWQKTGQVTVKENEMLLIKPKFEHYSFLKEHENSVSTIISLSVQRIDAEPHIFNKFCENADLINVQPQKITENFINSAECFYNAGGTGLKDKLYKKLLADEFIFSLLEIILPLEESKSEIKQATSAETGILLETLIDTDRSLSEISEMLGYSERQTRRIIKRDFGMTFTELQKYRNIENAKKLLQNMPDLTVGAVSVMSGFKNESLFYKTFKAETGYTPGGYRNKYEKQKNRHI